MILPIQEAHVNSVHQLCNTVFSVDFISLNYLKEYINSPHKKGLVLLEDNIVIGFISIHFLSPENLGNSVLKEEKWFVNETSDAVDIGFIRQVLIHPEYQKRGFALKLMNHVTDLFNKDVDLFLCVAWVMDGFTPLKKTLINSHFELRKCIKDYWHEDSLVKKYICPVCGNPCKCTAEVYFSEAQS